MYNSVLYMYSDVYCMLLKIVLCLSELASVAAQWVAFWWEEVVRVTINIELVRVGLVQAESRIGACVL
jgi:hypothetical protein